jgi:hypothetical protein
VRIATILADNRRASDKMSVTAAASSFESSLISGRSSASGLHNLEASITTDWTVLALTDFESLSGPRGTQSRNSGGMLHCWRLARVNSSLAQRLQGREQ